MSIAEWKQFLSHMWPRAPHYTPKDYPDLNGKVYIVTGAPTGIGFHTTRYLLQNNAKVWMVGRNQTKIEAAIKSLTTEMPSCKLDYFLADFSDLTTIKPGVDKFLKQEHRLDCVIHNAGVMMPSHDEITKQGFDWQIGVNCIGPWLLQRHLDDMLIKTGNANNAIDPSCTRVIWVASSAHMYAPVGFKWGKAVTGSKQQVYGISKAMNIMQAIIWSQKKHPSDNVVSLSVHPGNCKSEIQRDLTGVGKYFRQATFYDSFYGAFTELYAALHPKFETKSHHNGSYIIPFGQIGHARQDIVDDAKSERGDELLQWLDSATDQYIS